MQKENEKEKLDYIFKLVIIGNANCGKSSLLHYFINNKVKNNPAQTVGVEFASKMINIQNKNIKLQLWDTAGQERYRSVARTYYRGTLGALVIFDVTNKESQAVLKQWISDAREFGRQDIAIVVCANKIDLQQDGQSSTEQAQAVCFEENVEYIETSAVTGLNVEKAFQLMTETLLSLVNKGSIEMDDLKPRLLNPSINLQDQDKRKEQAKQCYYC